MGYLEELYEKIVEDSVYMETTMIKMEEEIAGIMRKANKIIPKAQQELFRDYLFQVANVTSREAFIVGYRYAFKLLIESLMEEDVK